MKIVTYVNTDGSAPAGQEAVARIWPTDNAKEPLPVFVNGTTEDEARIKAKAFFERELAKARANLRGGVGRPQLSHVTPDDLKAIAEQDAAGS